MSEDIDINELYNLFAEVITDSSADASKLPITGKADQETLIKIFRRNYNGALSHALAITYPTIKKLIGKECFQNLCHEYVAEHLPKDAKLDEYGEHLAELLRQHELSEKLPYIAEMAMFEWAFHNANLAEDDTSINLYEFSSLSVGELDQLKLKLHKSVHIISSKYKILEIWQKHQQEDQSLKWNININQPECLLLMRHQTTNKVEILPIEYCEYLFIKAINHDQTYMQATNELLNNNGNEAILVKLLQHIFVNGGFIK